MSKNRLLLLLLPVLLLACSACLAQPEEELLPQGEQQLPIDLGDEYEGYAKSSTVDAGGHTATTSIWRSVFLYLPNRLLDFIDIFRVDAGVGPAIGGVVRITKWGQAGIREVEPFSLRLGLHGRASPVFLEKKGEHGVGPYFVSNPERKTTPVEMGAGVDLFIIGVYAGVSVDSIFDFFGGIVGFDLSDDDYR